MKRIAILAMAAAMTCGIAQAADRLSDYRLDGVAVDSLRLVRNGEYLTVDMALDLTRLKVSGNRAVLLIPRLVNGTDSIDLPAVGVYGRRRYYTYVRNGEGMLTGTDEKSFKASERPDSLPYRADIDYADWMDGASLALDRREYGCCNNMLGEQYALLGSYQAPAEPFFPQLVYVRPKAEWHKIHSLKGSAYIDFPVDRAEINPDYRRNAVELGEIQATIDSVRSDRDVTVTKVWLKGYASPEGSFAHNSDLAVGRTNSLKQYIKQLYRFDDNIIDVDSEPENWAGLREDVVNSNLAHKSEIIDLIDSDLEPDAKERAIKSKYPDEYRFMLQNFYPALRRTDYSIEYEIRIYSDVNEIKRVFLTQPRKLSLNELYILAQEYEPGSAEFTEVFETAVRMYPDDPAANMNAANAAMYRGDNAAAARYLAKAGDTPEAVYARGALAIRNGDLESARSYLRQAEAAGLQQAAETLSVIESKNPRR